MPLDITDGEVCASLPVITLTCRSSSTVRYFVEQHESQIQRQSLVKTVAGLVSEVEEGQMVVASCMPAGGVPLSARSLLRLSCYCADELSEQASRCSHDCCWL